VTNHPDTHPQLARLLNHYARELAQVAPSSHLDARIDDLVATYRPFAVAPLARRPRRFGLYASAAGIAVMAIGVGIFIGMKVEHARRASARNAVSERDAVWPPADLTMWPTDSVSFKIPAEYSPQGTLVAVDPESKHASARYWIDVVVANDGTFRIERIVPADASQKKGGPDGVAPQVQ
jgi:hypothetical protein